MFYVLLSDFLQRDTQGEFFNDVIKNISACRETASASRRIQFLTSCIRATVNDFNEESIVYCTSSESHKISQSPRHYVLPTKTHIY